MHYSPITPFRRAVSAAQLEQVFAQDTSLPDENVNKWEMLRELATARESFSLSHCDISVLQALVSFRPGTMLDGPASELVVHPSNAAICDRLNGMPCSTMRRHLARLVEAGLIHRRDSPNGKRYVRRHGDTKIAYGFDLSPLVHRYGEIRAEAEATRNRDLAYRQLRETVSLMRRDLAGLIEYGTHTRPDLSLWDSLREIVITSAKILRRKLPLVELEELSHHLRQALIAARDVFETRRNTDEMSTKDTQNEQHLQNTNPESHESEKEPLHQNKDTRIPLDLVLTTVPEIQTYQSEKVRTWAEFVQLANRLRPMMGISPPTWESAKSTMGSEQAAVVLSVMLERFGKIRSPGAYLNSLARKAGDGGFSCMPMVMSLVRQRLGCSQL